jgi:hypothetical protein
MTRERAAELMDHVNATLEEAWMAVSPALIEIMAEEGWRALGYESSEAWARTLFGDRLQVVVDRHNAAINAGDPWAAIGVRPT